MTTPREVTRNEQLAWQVVSTVTGLLATLAVSRLLTLVWTRFVGAKGEAPPDLADRRISWPEAVIWAVALGVGGAIARLVAQRLAARGWEVATGTEPPGLHGRDTIGGTDTA
jgi:hypothetical protein